MGHPVERLPIDLVLFRTRLDPFEGPQMQVLAAARFPLHA
jgi:hypothetical protein